MRFLSGALTRVGDQALEAEVRDELQSHLEELRDALVESGMDPREAEERALTRFGNFEVTLRECVAERRKGTDSMKATLIALVLLLSGALLFTVTRARRIQAEEALAVAEMHQLSAMFEQERSQNEPRPVIYRVGDALRLSDLDGTLDGALSEVTVFVAEDGMALFPSLGWIEVHGKQREPLEAELQQRYEELLTDVSTIVVQRL